MSVDDIKNALTKMIQKIRKGDQSKLELEVRVGKFSTNHNFVPGYTVDHRILVNKMINRLETNCAEMPNWKMVPKEMFIRCFYSNNLRKTCIPNKKQTFMVKTRLSTLDILTERPYSIRIMLSNEDVISMTNNHVLYQASIKEAPVSMRFYLRATFIETVQITRDGNIIEFVFAYDVSKVSVNGKNKMTTTKEPCDYHVEIELKSKLNPVDNPVENALLCDLILARAKAVVGTYEKKNNIFQKLPDCKFVMLSHHI
jgi:hypothetical protein